MPSNLSLSRVVLIAVAKMQVFGIAIGQSVRCGADQPAIYRYMGGNVIRWYPDPNIAASYDPNWGSPLLISCANMQVGSALPYNPAAGLSLYQAVTCSSHDPQGYGPGVAVYQLAGRSTIRWLPNPDIANRCVPNWAAVHPAINCGPLYHAEVMDSNCELYAAPANCDTCYVRASIRYYP